MGRGGCRCSNDLEIIDLKVFFFLKSLINDLKVIFTLG